MGFEYVDAESPEWPAPGEPRARRAGATSDHGDAATREDADVEPLDFLRARAVERARRALAGRRTAPVTEAWQEQPIHAALFCAVDLETTGSAAAGEDEIVEIGAVQLDGSRLGREFSTCVDPRRPISHTARAVHGIRDTDVWTAPRLEHALPWLLETVRDRVLVFHNAAFDLAFLQRALVATERRPFEQPVLDTLHLARRLVGGRCSLATLARRFRIDAPQPHRALADARVTAALAIELLGACVDAGAERLGDLPGVQPRPLRQRPAERRTDALVERLERAVRGQEQLRVSYHAAAGVEPLALEVRPRRLLGALHLLAHDAVRGEDVVLELARIGHLRAVR